MRLQNPTNDIQEVPHLRIPLQPRAITEVSDAFLDDPDIARAVAQGRLVVVSRQAQRVEPVGEPLSATKRLVKSGSGRR